MLPCGKTYQMKDVLDQIYKIMCVIADVYISEVGSNHLFCFRIYDFLKLASCMQD
jgi:hypothetical protein